MKIVKFKECNVNYAENQPEYLPLPAHRSKSGVATSCWGLSFRERLKVLLTGQIYLSVLTFHKPLQPLEMLVNKPSDLKEL
jgi:hypothetical protein